MSTLTEEQKIIFRNEVETDPDGRGYQAMLTAGRPGYVIDALNEQTSLMHKETWITDISLMSRLGVDVARSIIGKLKAMSAGGDVVILAVVKRIEGGGLDIGDPEALSMIDQCTVEPDGFTVEENEALKGLSMQYASRMEVLRLPFATGEMLRDMQ